MRIRDQLLAFAVAAAATSVLAAAIVLVAGRREDAAADAQARAQVAEHEAVGLVVLTQEYARDARPRAAEQWRRRHAAIAAALADRGQASASAALAQLHAAADVLPALFSRLEALPPGNAAAAARRQALLDRLLADTQALGDDAYQWQQEAVAARDEAEREFKWIALGALAALLLLMLASGVAVQRRLLLPMRRLDRAAAAVRRGDFSHRIDSASQDESGELSRGFDAMTAALADSGRQRDRSERQLRDITDNLPALVAYIDLGQHYRFANEKYREWLGRDPAAMIGRTVAEVLGEAQAADAREALGQALDGRRSQWTRAVVRDGREAHLLAEYIPDNDADGRVRGCYALTIDITERHEAGQRMRRSEQRMAELTNAIPAMVGYFDMNEVCHYANDAGLRSLGLNHADAPGITMRAALGETIYAQHEPFVREALQGRRARLEGRVPFQGREAHFQAHLIPDRIEGGAQRGFYLMTFDITALKEAETRRARAERQLRAITDNLPVAITYLDRDQRYRFVNRTGLRWIDRDAGEVIGQRIGDVLPPAPYETMLEHLRRALAGERQEFGLEIPPTAGGEARVLNYVYVPDLQPDGGVAGVYGLGSDVTALKNVERQLSLLVRSDTLTGLANRYQFNETLPLALARARRAGNSLALMYLDIDRFKSVNDTLGHAAGDEVLKAFAARLAQTVRTTDTVARLGGDEFILILEGLKLPDEPGIVARKIIASVTRPMEIGGRPLSIGTSIGVAFCSRVTAQEMGNAAGLIARADEALYAAKAAGRGTWRVLVDGVSLAEEAIT
jgi:diguanylate cyclase (GGDEF)-like protein/PAS domain S-box-containing protein